MDKLSTALSHFSVSAGVFYTGELCDSRNFHADNYSDGHLHFVKDGHTTLQNQDGQKKIVVAPAVIFFPYPASYLLEPVTADKPQVVCANIRYGTGTQNPLARAFPPLLVVKVNQVAGLQSIAELLIDEAFHARNAREAMMNRLMEMFVISLLRHMLDLGVANNGMLSGLSHPQLCKAILAIHDAPQKNWTIEKLAALAAMSRSKFFKSFHDCVGVSAGEYILEWRVALAQEYLKRGKPVGWIANAVGYGNSSTFAKMFRKKTGYPPKAWLQVQTKNSRQCGACSPPY